MNYLSLIIDAILLGIGLAMDAFSVSLANGLQNPNMAKSKTITIAGVFGLFQTLMPLIGWVCVHSLVERFDYFLKAVPYVAFVLLAYIGGKMVYEGLKNDSDAEEGGQLSLGALLIQGIATSIDALSVGFTIATLSFYDASLESLIIGVVTFIICLAGLKIGKKFGTKFSNKATIIGGCILLFIGIKILVGNFI